MMVQKLNPGPVGAHPAAIVFIHGFGGDRESTWGNIPALLQSDQRLRDWDMFCFGYESHKRFDLRSIWSADPRIEEIAIKLNSVPEFGSAYQSFALVAHSMGGLVVQRALVLNPALLKRTSHVFLLGTPSSGLTIARYTSWLKQQAKSMSATGEFIAQLRSDWTRLSLDTAPTFKFFVAAGETDQFVPPASSLAPFPEAVRRVIPGNHITMLDVQSASDPLIKLLAEGLTGGAALAGPRNSALVAVEAGEFQRAIDRLWPGRTELDDGGAVQLAIALDGVGRRADAIGLLRERPQEGTDCLGVLAGRLKRRWLLTRSAEDFRSAREFYQRGYAEAAAKEPTDFDQAYYHGINLAYLALAGSIRDDRAAHETATKVVEYARAARNPAARHWARASEGDALVILDRFDEGLEKHKEAARCEPSPWAALSMEEQALRIADLCGAGRERMNKITAVYEGGEAK